MERVVRKPVSKEKHREYAQRWRARNHEEILRRERERRSTPEHKAKQKAWYAKSQANPQHRMRRILTKAKRRAERAGLPFSDLLEAFLLANPPTACVCCGRSFDYALDKGHNSDSASLDRIDNTKGYVIGNVATICRRCNRLKGDATLEEVEAIAAYMRSPAAVQCA
jgi:hypothetical protein